MKPRILIASSVEGKDIAEALQVNLDRDTRPTVWHQAFPLSANTIDTLLENSARHDFAVFVFSADDLLRMRHHEYQTPRDNVVIEYGFFVGMHGKDRAFIVAPRNKPELHLPTDLIGLNVADYDDARAKNEARAALGPATTLIKEAISRSTWVRLRPIIKAESRPHRPAAGQPGISFPLKLSFEITNDHPYAVTIESLSFTLDSGLRFAANSAWSKPKFRIGKDDAGHDVYEFSCVIEPGSKKSAWVGIHPDIADSTLEAAVKNKSACSWQFRCSWLCEPVISCNYEDSF